MVTPVKVGGEMASCENREDNRESDSKRRGGHKQRGRQQSTQNDETGRILITILFSIPYREVEPLSIGTSLRCEFWQPSHMAQLLAEGPRRI